MKAKEVGRRALQNRVERFLRLLKKNSPVYLLAKGK